MRQTTSMKLDPVVKQEAQEIFATLGLTLGEAVNLFLTQVKLKRGIPFELKIPNELTQSVMDDVRKGKNMEPTSIEQIKQELEGMKHTGH
jgi:DNA-damage-inducible protein J